MQFLLEIPPPDATTLKIQIYCKLLKSEITLFRLHARKWQTFSTIDLKATSLTWAALAITDQKSFIRSFEYHIQILSIKISPVHHCAPTQPPLDHDVNKLESPLPDDASTWISAFLANCFFLRRGFLKFFLHIFLCRILTLIVAPPYAGVSWYEQTWVYSTWCCFDTTIDFWEEDF